MTRRWCLHVILVVGLPLPAAGQNWPMFRGPNASGAAEGAAPPIRWNASTSEHIRWKAPIPGLGHSSPVVWGDRVFVTTTVGQEPAARFKHDATGGRTVAADTGSHRWRVYCLDKATGKVLWERTARQGVPRTRRHVRASQANATPATDGRHLVVFFGSEGLYCYDLDGKLLWSRDLGVLDAGYVGLPEYQWGTASSPLLYGNLAIVQCDSRQDSFLAAFDLQTGRQAWRVERDELPSWATPILRRRAAGTELITVSPRFIRGIDPLNGGELWRFSDHAEVKVPTPLASQDLIVVSGGAPQGRHFFALRPQGTGDISLPAGQETNAHLAWRVPKGGPYTPTPIAYRDHLYVVSDNAVLSCYTLRDGELVYQQRVPSAGGTYSASPVAADGNLYLSHADGEIHVVKAGPQFELLASNPMGEVLMATPAIADGMLFVRGQHHLFAIGRQPRP